MENKTVLVVEDNEMNMELVRTLLQIGNYRILEADNAEEGIRIAREEKPDLILMDVQLPGMNGLEATKTIKSDDEVGETPVVILTGYGAAIDDMVEEIVYDGCITKPIETRKFLRTIADYLK